jgi:hypothetical protein
VGRWGQEPIAAPCQQCRAGARRAEPVPAVVRAVLGRKNSLPPVPAVPCCAPEELRPVPAVVAVRCARERKEPYFGASNRLCARAEASASSGAVRLVRWEKIVPQCQQCRACARRAEDQCQQWCRAVCWGERAHYQCQQCRAVRQERRTNASSGAVRVLGNYIAPVTVPCCAPELRPVPAVGCRAVCWEKRPIAPVPAVLVLCRRAEVVTSSSYVQCAKGEEPLPPQVPAVRAVQKRN